MTSRKSGKPSPGTSEHATSGRVLIDLRRLLGPRMGDGTSTGSAMAGVSSTCVGATEGAGGTGRGGTEGKGYNRHSDY